MKSLGFNHGRLLQKYTYQLSNNWRYRRYKVTTPVFLLLTWRDKMRDMLEFIKEEDEKTYSDNGALLSSLEKKYFNFICRCNESTCHTGTPMLCRQTDKFRPFDEAIWRSDKKECSRCFKTNSRLLEDIYLKSA
jgi:hypothetical protein